MVVMFLFLSVAVSEFDLVNVHLFHDVSNIVAMEAVSMATVS